MADRDKGGVVDKAEAGTGDAGTLQQLAARADRAEAEAAELREAVRTMQAAAATQENQTASEEQATTHAAERPERRVVLDAEAKQPPSPSSAGDETRVGGGEAELRKDSMMAHLLDSLQEGKDIGHYGRLVFAMVARHFMPHTDVIGWLTRDGDFSEEDAQLMLSQTEGRDYSPPRRERLLEWQSKQEFPILPKPDDPDCGNLYRNLTFPQEVYSHIGHYQEQKRESAGE